jgi:excisionase family DNA binding protein
VYRTAVTPTARRECFPSTTLIVRVRFRVNGASIRVEANSRDCDVRRKPTMILQPSPHTNATRQRDEWPVLLTIDEAAALLRTTRRAMYAMVERRQIPGVVRIRRRVLFRTEALLDWVDQKSAPQPKE